MSTLNPYVVTFNCGREKIQPDRFADHLFEALPTPRNAPDILVLALQEVAPIAYSFLGGSYLAPYLSRFHHAVNTAAATAAAASSTSSSTSSPDNAGYVNIVTRNVGMTVIMVFVLRDQRARVQRLETAGVGVGVRETGHKSAVAVRMGYSVGEEDSTLEICFVSAHLAPMEDGLQRRNEDWENIVRGLVFESASSSPSSSSSSLRQKKKKTRARLPHQGSEEEDTSPLLAYPRSEEASSISSPMIGIYTPTSHLILAGDLNYRTSQSPPSPSTPPSMFPQPCEDDSYPQHFWHLFNSDQLTRELRAQRTCHGLQEATVDFPPTYKYGDRGRAVADKNGAEMDDVGHYWDWSEHRWPSWCDRVLFLDLPPWMKAKDKGANVDVLGYRALPLMQTSDHRPVACSFSIPAVPIPKPNEAEEASGGVRTRPPFDLNPLWKERRAAARRREIVVGIGAYMTITWEGRGILIAVVVGALAGWLLIGSVV